jgi:hypothetical protein
MICESTLVPYIPPVPVGFKAITDLVIPPQREALKVPGFEFVAAFEIVVDLD